MDKPKSLSVKDFLIRKMSVKMMIPEYVLDAIISHQFQSANEALKTNKSVEISGWGKFLFNDGKAIKRMEKGYSQKAMFTKIMNDESLPEYKRKSAEVKLKNVISYMETLQPKICGEKS